jgi:hypothetical protein
MPSCKSSDDKPFLCPRVEDRGAYCFSCLCVETLTLAISRKLYEISTWNFVCGYVSMSKRAMHKNYNSSFHNFWVLALWFCYTFIFSWAISRKLYEISTSNFMPTYISFWYFCITYEQIMYHLKSWTDDKFVCFVFMPPQHLRCGGI